MPTERWTTAIVKAGMFVMYERAIILNETMGNVMPIYEYHCEGCDCYKELKQGINDPHAAVCPICSEPLTRKVSRSTFIWPSEGQV
jgi:putative FmdB family regulatory protein